MVPVDLGDSEKSCRGRVDAAKLLLFTSHVNRRHKTSCLHPIAVRFVTHSYWQRRC
jgi:hypothetical protein